MTESPSKFKPTKRIAYLLARQRAIPSETSSFGVPATDCKASFLGMAVFFASMRTRVGVALMLPTRNKKGFRDKLDSNRLESVSWKRSIAPKVGNRFKVTADGAESTCHVSFESETSLFQATLTSGNTRAALPETESWNGNARNAR